MNTITILCLVTFTLGAGAAAQDSSKYQQLSPLMRMNTYDVLKAIQQRTTPDACNTICCKQYNHYMEKIFEQDWATIMLDASSKIQAGILRGNLYELGSYDECISIKANTSEGRIKGQYCMGKIKLPDTLFEGHWGSDRSVPEALGAAPETREMMMPSEDVALSLKFALCVPDSCPTDELNQLINDVMNALSLQFIDVHCYVDKTYDIEGMDILAIVLLSITGLCLILSTCYDLYLNQINSKTSFPILICFSLYTNGFHLFKTTPVQNNAGMLNSLVGIRFLSMAWIVYAHCYFISAAFPIFNYMDSDTFVRSITGQFIVGSSITVDTFLVMSGLLVSYTLLRQFKKGIKLIDIPFIYIHRYIRITPPYAMMILLQISLVKFFGSGPLWDTTFQAMASGCQKYWWSSLLYIQNYVNPEEVCLGQSWYLSVDMQLFWLAPLLMIFIGKFRRFTYVIIGALAVVFAIATFIIAFENSLLAGMIAGTREMMNDRKVLTYEPTHTRAAPWMVGLALGYLLHENRGKRIVMHPILVAVGWFVCLGTMSAVIFGMYPLMQKGYELNKIADPSYLAFSRPAWGLAVAWLILACENGYGGPINWLLTLPIWQPLARLSYCEYLVHFVLQASVGGAVRAPIYFNNFQMFYKLLSDMSFSMLFAACLSLTYESPMIIIEKTIFGKGKKESIPPTQRNDIESEENGNTHTDTETKKSQVQ